MFDLEPFIAECRAALAADRSQTLVHEVVARAVSEPAAVLKGLGEPRRAEIRTLHHASDLTILNVIWGPKMSIVSHDHRMWAVIGIFSGCEENTLWRRLPHSSGQIERIGARELRVGDVESLDHNVIHSVINPIPRLTSAIHVYGGDFFAAERSEWHPETLMESRYDAARLLRCFEEANGAIKNDHQRNRKRRASATTLAYEEHEK
jgi:predicted metal-dependent enzyme (double-stranded beta helix superfamily)